MRISELLNESEMLDEISRPSKMDDATRILYNAGYEQVGEGYYAEVFARPDDKYVLKLFDYRDAQYRKFVAMAMNNRNPHYPQFRGKLIKVAAEYYAVRMEMLSPLSNTGAGWNSKSDVIRAITRYCWEYWNESCAPSAQKLLNPTSPEITIDELEKHQPGIKQACKNIVDILSNINQLDIHGDNVMMRGNVLVITDPVS